MVEKEMWTPSKRLAYLPYFPRELFIEEGTRLYEELLNNRLEIVLVSAPIQKHTNHKIRSVQLHNPEWYSQIYSAHNRGKRKMLEKSLWRIVNRLDKDFNTGASKPPYSYDAAFRSLIYSRFVDGYFTEEGSRVSSDNDVRNFFNLGKIEIYDEEKPDCSGQLFVDQIPF